MQTISKTLTSLTIGNPVTHQYLTMFPLLNGGSVEAGYITLDEAMAAGTVQVSEVSRGGSVPELQFVNSGGTPVLLLDGEELVGAKQNRALNLTILAPAKSTIIIPVSCVEQGRWSYRSADFKSSDKTQFAEGRARKARSVSFAMDALDRSSTVTEMVGGAPQKSVADEFLKVVAAAEASTHEAVGMGTDLRLQSQFVAGGALEVDGKVVHLCAFPSQMADRQPADGIFEMIRSSRRRRRS